MGPTIWLFTLPSAICHFYLGGQFLKFFCSGNQKLYKTDLIRAEIELTTLAMIENDYIRRYTFNYHTITDTEPHLTYSKIEINCGMF
jgi:hypothetical protein